MDILDAKMVLGALVDNLFDKYFPDLKQEGEIRGVVLELYLDFVADKIGYWTSVKTSVLITGQLNLREAKSSPVATVEVILNWAIKTMEVITEDHKKNNSIMEYPLADPEIHRFFQSSFDSSSKTE